MNTQLVEIQPRELKFLCEAKKQSSCAVHLANITDQHVAFKVKTTSPKKYCVRPNIGIIKPKSAYDFTVTMQAQKSAPSEMQCKDKFLIQVTVVPFGTTEDEITPGMFSKDSANYIEETKLRVALTSAPNSPVVPQVPGVLKQEASYEALTPKEQHSPVLIPINGVSKQEASYEALTPKEPHSPVLIPINGVSKQEPSYETSIPNDKLQTGDENFPPPDMLMKKVEAIKNIKNMEESRSRKAMDNNLSVPAKDEDSKRVKDMEDANLKLAKDLDELKSKISLMEVKLAEAEQTIVKLSEEKSSRIHEKEILEQELATLSRTSGARKVQVGFPPLFVCMVAMICLMIGFSFRS